MGAARVHQGAMCRVHVLRVQCTGVLVRSSTLCLTLAFTLNYVSMAKGVRISTYKC